MTRSPSAIQGKLDELGGMLRQKAVAQAGAKYTIEQRWLEDTRQYHGQYSEETEARLTADKTGASRIFVNLTRPKCEALESRLAEMLFPTDDRNWEITPTPNPELASGLRSPNPAAVESAQTLQQAAKRAAEAMQRLMDDQLTETQYSEKAKAAIHDAVVLGTGVLKGPVIAARSEKRWVAAGGVQVLSVQQIIAPEIEVVSPWDFFPDMSAASLSECEFVFERRFITRRTLRQLAQRPGYRAESIREVLRDDPRGSRISDWQRAQLREVLEVGQPWDETQYEWWQYHGPIEREDAEALGLSLPDDPLIGLEVMVEFVGTRVIRVELHPLDTQDTVYSLFSLVEDDSTPFGYGVPYLLRSAQTALNAAWRMMLDNAALAVGPQIIINQHVIKPADGIYALSPRKLWLLNDPTRNVREAFEAFQVQSNQPELMGIIELARALIEKESNIPDLMQGDLGSMPQQTASGMSMAMNAANTVLRRLVKRWDDQITKTLIRRFYDYNMQYSELQDVKGDFEVDARGSSALMVKETQAQSLMQLLQLAQSPTLLPLTKISALYRKLVETLRLSADELVYSDDELTAMQQQQAAMQQQQAAIQQQAQLPAPDPQVQMAQQQQQLDAEKTALQAQLKRDEIAARERVEMAKLADKEQDRQMEFEKEALRAEQLDAEARLKMTLGSGL